MFFCPRVFVRVRPRAVEHILCMRMCMHVRRRWSRTKVQLPPTKAYTCCQTIRLSRLAWLATEGCSSTPCQETTHPTHTVGNRISFWLVDPIFQSCQGTPSSADVYRTIRCHAPVESYLLGAPLHTCRHRRLLPYHTMLFFRPLSQCACAHVQTPNMPCRDHVRTHLVHLPVSSNPLIEHQLYPTTPNVPNTPPTKPPKYTNIPAHHSKKKMAITVSSSGKLLTF